MNDVLFGIQREIILSLSDREDCVIVGRCANHILTGDDTLHIFIYAPFETRVKTIMERLDREEKSARKLVKRMNKECCAYYQFFTDQKWMDMAVRILRIHSSKFSQDAIIQIIKDVCPRRNSKVAERTFPPLVLFRDIFFQEFVHWFSVRGQPSLWCLKFLVQSTTPSLPVFPLYPWPIQIFS